MKESELEETEWGDRYRESVPNRHNVAMSDDGQNGGSLNEHCNATLDTPALVFTLLLAFVSFSPVYVLGDVYLLGVS